MKKSEGDPLPVLRVVLARGHGDCGIACLSMLLGLNYEDVFAAAVASTKDRRLHQTGMWVSQIMRVAGELGITLHRRRRWDLETSTGILGLENVRTGEGHVVVLNSGLIIDVDGALYQPDVFFSCTAYKATVLLTAD